VQACQLTYILIRSPASIQLSPAKMHFRPQMNRPSFRQQDSAIADMVAQYCAMRFFAVR